ncbi:MAG: hypothetical protein J0L97_10600 [Alphaproteobacteria bacterium]|nr:hypothetical protein [Alphaproteobacteria bacterium]
MNLRISEGCLRFRITRGEMDLLMKDETLSFSLQLGSKTVEYSISTVHSERPLWLDVDKNTWRLLVDQDDLKYFAASLPSREGIEQDVVLGGTALKLVLEVDVRRKQAA